MIPLIDYKERSEKLRAILTRDVAFGPEVEESVRRILQDVQRRGDDALRDYTEQFDGVRLEALKVPMEALIAASNEMEPVLCAVIAEATANIRRFHERQRQDSWFTDDGGASCSANASCPSTGWGCMCPAGRPRIRPAS
jgi:histidinol dehydrogenase